jgi:hypothetical protein
LIVRGRAAECPSARRAAAAKANQRDPIRAFLIESTPAQRRREAICGKFFWTGQMRHSGCACSDDTASRAAISIRACARREHLRNARNARFHAGFRNVRKSHHAGLAQRARALRTMSARAVARVRAADSGVAYTFR